MTIAPLDLRLAQFGLAVRGFSRPEVASFLNQAADAYEQTLRDTDRLRQEVGALREQLDEHRQRETTLRDTLLTAERISAESRESAKQEAQLIVQEARGQADELIRKAAARCQDIEREITDLRLTRTDMEASLESSITTLRHMLDFVKQRDRDRHQDDTTSRHHPKPVVAGNGTVRPAPRPVITVVESQPSA